MWISHFAVQLVCEVAEQMGAIRLSCDPALSMSETTETDMDTVCALIGGDYSISVQFCAERALFVRFARNMLGEEPGEDEVREYAREFLNVICGRFISELINRADIKVTLMPISYEISGGCTGSSAEMRRLKFISDVQEYAIFSWTPLPIEELLRRGMSQ